MNAEDAKCLKEQLITIRNLCDISLVVLGAHQDELLPTILEFLLLESQQIVEAHCQEN